MLLKFIEGLVIHIIIGKTWSSFNLADCEVPNIWATCNESPHDSYDLLACPMNPIHLTPLSLSPTPSKQIASRPFVRWLRWQLIWAMPPKQGLDNCYKNLFSKIYDNKVKRPSITFNWEASSHRHTNRLLKAPFFIVVLHIRKPQFSKRANKALKWKRTTKKNWTTRKRRLSSERFRSLSYGQIIIKSE